MPESYRVAVKWEIRRTLFGFYLWAELALQRVSSECPGTGRKRDFWSENTIALVHLVEQTSVMGLPPFSW
jgi:hypothetical protein